MGMPITGFKKKIGSLLRRMETRKGCGVKASGGKREPFLSSHSKREILPLECSANYNSSPLIVRGRGRSSGDSALIT